MGGLVGTTLTYAMIIVPKNKMNVRRRRSFTQQSRTSNTPAPSPATTSTPQDGLQEQPHTVGKHIPGKKSVTFSFDFNYNSDAEEVGFSNVRIGIEEPSNIPPDTAEGEQAFPFSTRAGTTSPPAVIPCYQYYPDSRRSSAHWLTPKTYKATFTPVEEEGSVDFTTLLDGEQAPSMVMVGGDNSASDSDIACYSFYADHPESSGSDHDTHESSMSYEDSLTDQIYLERGRLDYS